MLDIILAFSTRPELAAIPSSPLLSGLPKPKKAVVGACRRRSSFCVVDADEDRCCSFWIIFGDPRRRQETPLQNAEEETTMVMYVY